jgi:hypothetical protein
MKNSAISKLIQLILLGVFTFTTSCTRRDLELPSGEGTVNIVFDWGNLYPGEVMPSGMKIYFYGSNGSVITRDCSGSGYSGTLPTDTYNVLVYNAGSSNVNYSILDNYSNALASVPSVTKSAYLSQPSYAYGVGLSGLTVSSDHSATATMKPLAFVKKADIKINFTGNVSAVSSCSCTVDGLADVVKIATGDIQSTTGAVSFVPAAITGGYESVISFFGRTPASSNNISIVLNFTGGGSQIVNVDISSGLAKLSSTVVAVDINLNIDVTGSVAAGFSATLKDWNVVDRDIIVI